MPFDTIVKVTRMVQLARQLLPLHGIGIFRLTIAFMIVFGSLQPAMAARYDAGIAGLCDRAAIAASRTKGVPLDVMRAISRTETGRSSGGRLEPWPWTVNMEGTGRWFATLDEARSYVFQHFKNGARSFDVGCFQINYKWHGDAFRSIDDMFDPEMNAQYAAQFLSELYQEFGNWPDAAGAYHSRTPEFARKYVARFDRIRADLSGDTELALVTRNDAGHRSGIPNRDLLQPASLRPLIRGGTVALGSLVPIMRHAGAGPRPFVVLE